MHDWFKVCAIAAIASFAVAAPAAAQTSKSPGAATKLSQAQCESLWNRADAAKSGSLSQAQAQPYVKDFGQVDANGDGRISRAEFSQGCSAGNVQSSAGTGAGSGTQGSGAPSAPGGPKK